ncbi:MAG: multidrug efflux pump subunit AcrB [Alteromonadaceae bacterium]|jgi:multidrug efflux pump subunit AcrB
MIAWFTRHPVAANLLMMTLLLGGLLSANNMRKEIIPKLPASEVNISAYYEGRTAQQIDKELGQKIELALQGIAGIKHITSTSSQNSINITVKKKLDHSMERLLADIKSNVENIYDWPQFAEKPNISRNEDSFDALMVQLSGDTDKDTLIKVAHRVKQALMANPEIHKMDQYGAHDYSIYINVNPDKMRQLGLTFDEISEAISQQSVRSKSGLLKTDNGQYLIYSEQHAQHQRELAELVIKVSNDGNVIYLADIANIDDGFVEHDSDIHFNGQPTIGFAIKMSAKSDVLNISAQAQQVVKQLNKTLPDNLALTIWFDASTYVQERLDLLQNNALQGFILVFILLSLFLQIRLAFWVAMGLPVAIAGTFIVLGELGFQYTINEITTFGFILVLGILVDDAVVVGESIYSSKEQQGDDIEATINGVHKVAIATIFGVLTTVAALLPMTQFPSETGRLFAGFAWVVIIALLFSLIESKLILPAHLRHIKIKKIDTVNSSKMKQTFFNIRMMPQRGLTWCNHNIYLPLLKFSLRYRYAWLMCFFAISLSVIGSLYQGKIRSVLFPDVSGDLIILTVELEANSPLSLVQQVMDKAETVKSEINKKYQQQFNIEKNVINKSMTVMYEQGVILIFAELIHKSNRPDVNIKTIAQLWRTPLSTLEAVISAEAMTSLEGTSNGTRVIFQHPDPKILDKIVKSARSWLSNQQGVRNIKEDQADTMPQLMFTLKNEAQLFGITRRMLADQLAAAYGGLEVDRFYRDEQRVKVYLSFPRSLRDSRMDFNKMYIFNDKNIAIPLLAVANIHPDIVQNSVSRYDGANSRSLLIDVNKEQSSPEQIYQGLSSNFYQKISSQYPLFTIKRAGELEETVDTKSGLVTAFIIALTAIYILLAVPLKRYGQPLLIMAAIPFGVVGAIFGHLWLGLSVSLYSWLGILTLSGVVVNDSLLIVTGYNELREKSNSQLAAIYAACQNRFRAIFLTTITTFAGLYPLLSETSEQAQYLIPAAASMAYGLLFATLITLFLIPILIVVSTDIKRFITEQQWRSSPVLTN